MGLNLGGIIRAVLPIVGGLLGTGRKSASAWASIAGQPEAASTIDAALEAFDALTGDTGLDLIGSLPNDKEEKLFDHLKEAIRIIAYNKAKVDGFYFDANQLKDEMLVHENSGE